MTIATDLGVPRSTARGWLEPWIVPEYLCLGPVVRLTRAPGVPGGGDNQLLTQLTAIDPYGVRLTCFRSSATRGFVRIAASSRLKGLGETRFVFSEPPPQILKRELFIAEARMHPRQMP